MPASVLPAVLFVGSTARCRDRVRAALPDGVPFEAVPTWAEAEARLRPHSDWVVVAEEASLPAPEPLRAAGRRHAIVVLVGASDAYEMMAAHGVTDVLDGDTFSAASLRATLRFVQARSGAQAPITARFRSLVQAVPDLIARLDAAGNASDIHVPDEFPAAVTPGSSTRGELDRVIGAETMRRVLEACRQSHETGVRQRVAYRTTVAGAERYREAVCVAIAEGDYLVLIRDTTDLVEAQAQSARSEDELQLRTELLREVAQSAPIVFFSLDAEGRFVQMEGRGLEALGIAPEDLIGVSAFERFEASNPSIVRSVRAALAGDRVSILLDYEGRFFETTYSPLRDAEGRVTRVVGVATDVTERIAVQEELVRSQRTLRELAAHLQSVREEERAHISREVHDVLGQALTALRLRVGWLASKLPGGDPAVAERVADTEALIDDTIGHVRELATRLRPGVLDDFGLVSAMEWQAERFTARTEVPVRLAVAPGIDETAIPKDVATALFRIAQEALTNVARHAEASAVRVSLEEADGVLQLTVHDDGVGMPTAPSGARRSLGLLGMRERALILGGSVEVRSAPGQGTTLVATVPLLASTPSADASAAPSPTVPTSP